MQTTHCKGKMNQTEQRYASYLDQLKAAKVILDYKFEPFVFKLAGKAQTYTIDFLVWYPEGVKYVEVKIGWAKKIRGHIGVTWGTAYRPGWRPDAWEKFKQLRGEFPMLDIECWWWHPGKKAWEQQPL